FLDLAREQAGEDGAATTPGRTWGGDGHGGGLGTHGFGDSLGDLQDPPTVAKARAQAAYGRGTPRPHRKILRKIGEVRGDRPTPAVDGLAGITDRGDRVPFTEQSPQQNELGVAGVLVLVEENHAEATAFDQSDLGVV